MNNLRTVSGITSDRREDKCIRRRCQSLHESIDSVPDDRSTIRHSVYNKHQTCTAVCRQVVHESKSIIIRDIQFMHTLYRKLELVEEITNAIDDCKSTVGVFIDLKKACDTVDHNILIKN